VGLDEARAVLLGISDSTLPVSAQAQIESINTAERKTVGNLTHFFIKIPPCNS
jgi:hypothetical protein